MMGRVSTIIDWRNALLVLVVIFVVLILGFLVPYQRSKDSPPAMDPEGDAEITVEYKDHGFEPETISVPLGTTVGWVHTSNKPMWVASDPHPAHTDLKGFDQLRVISRIYSFFTLDAHAHSGEIYKFTFDKIGNWKYHNHLYPEQRGIVVVTEETR